MKLTSLDRCARPIYDGGMGIPWSYVLAVAGRLPLEKWLFRPPDKLKQLQELRTILETNPPATKVEDSPIVGHVEEAPFKLEPRRQPVNDVRDVSHVNHVSNQETIDYQNREIGKLLLRMERHCVQKFRINGVACECGAQKHLLDLESLCEETVPMVAGNPRIYYDVIELGKELGPKCVPDVVATGKYDQEFPEYANKYRDFRKQLIGVLDVKSLFETRVSEDQEGEVKNGQDNLANG